MPTSIDDILKKLLQLHEITPDHQKTFEEAKALYQKFKNAQTYEAAEKAAQTLVDYIEKYIKFHYYMGSSTSLDKTKLENEIAQFEALLAEEIRITHHQMSEFLENQRQAEEEALYEEKIEVEKGKLDAFIQQTYALAKAVEKMKQSEYEQYRYTQTTPSDSSIERHKTIYAPVRSAVEETIKDVFESLNLKKPMTEEENKMYTKAKALYQAFENEKDFDRARDLLNRLINCIKIFKYSHYDEYTQKDDKNLDLNDLYARLETAKRQELFPSSNTLVSQVLNTIETISNRLSALAQSFTQALREKESVPKNAPQSPKESK